MSRETKRYDKDLKERILSRLKAPTDDTVPSLALEYGIPKSTIYQWNRENKSKKDKLAKIDKNKWSSEDKFQVVLETAALSEHDLGEYCRKRGVFVEDVKNWRDQCAKANAGLLDNTQKLKEELKEEKEKNKELAKELRTKEKALAETAALLVLRKKARAVWGDPEED